MSAERRFYEWLRMKLPGHVQRIESSTGAGIPDVVQCCDGITNWVELKVQDSHGRILLRKEQYAWGSRHAACGGRVWLLAKAEGCVKFWRFPMIVAPYGVSGKYVEPATLEAHLIFDECVADRIRTILLSSQ